MFLFKITFTMKSMKWYLSGKMRPSSPSQASNGHVTNDPSFSLPLGFFGRDQELDVTSQRLKRNLVTRNVCHAGPKKKGKEKKENSLTSFHIDKQHERNRAYVQKCLYLSPFPLDFGMPFQRNHRKDNGLEEREDEPRSIITHFAVVYIIISMEPNDAPSASTFAIQSSRSRCLVIIAILRSSVKRSTNDGRAQS